MARETQPPTSSGRNPFGLPGAAEHLPRGASRPHGYALRGNPRFGAAAEAPTAPHATSATGDAKVLTGPARFWRDRGIRLALIVTFAFSAALHWFVAPWQLMPSASGVEFKDPEGDLSIPVDLLGADEPPPEPAPPPPVAAPPPSPTSDPTAPGGKPDAGPKPVVDAGIKLAAGLDAGVEDQDGGAPTDAGESDGGAITDAGLVAVADAAAGSGSGSGARDPESMFGLSKVVNAGVQNVVLGVNVVLVRKHPVGSRMGPILTALPQWKDFLRGAPVPVDPIRDTDWLLIYGPSLIHTDKDAVLIRYNVPDEAVDTTIGGIANSYDKGGPFDAGVPGVKASLGYADNAQRVFLRPQSRLLVIVPPSHAHEAALTFKKQAPRGPSAKEAMRLIVHNPSNQISIPGLKFPASLKEIRLWIIPHDSDASADVFAEGDCTDEAAATDTAERLTEVLKRINSIGVKFATRGLLNGAVVVPDGSKITLHVRASGEQLEAILQLVAASVNAQVAPPSGVPGAVPPPTPRE